VFDNVDDLGLGLPSFLPQGSHGSILITTRLRGLALLGQGPNSACNVGGMDPQEALELLLKKARMHEQALSNKETEAATELVKVSSGDWTACAMFYIAYMGRTLDIWLLPSYTLAHTFGAQAAAFQSTESSISISLELLSRSTARCQSA
jgi:hypothetical protein